MSFHRQLLATLVALIVPCISLAADPAPRCPFSGVTDDSILVGWTTNLRGTSDGNGGRITVGAFRPLVTLKDGKILESEGASIKPGQRFWYAVDTGRGPVKPSTTSSFYDNLGPDHCVYHATVDPLPPVWTLLTSKPLKGVFRPPTAAERKMWSAIKPECRQFADYDEKNPPPCRTSEILAVSDINHNGEAEFWATAHYAWDTGLTIWEDRGELLPVPLLTLCVGCSD